MPKYSMPDVLVVIPGILGSVLRQHGREVWGLSAAAGMHALGSRGSSLRGLALTEDDSDLDAPVDGVETDGILRDLHVFPYVWKIDGYTSLAKTLSATFSLDPGGNYFEFAYDWRRDNRAAARRLARESQDWLRRWRMSSGNDQAKLIIIAHSMGGLVARYFLEVLEGWRYTKALITFGTPYRGSVNALATLVEGVKKGPFGVIDLSLLARSFTSLYQLLPTYPCLITPRGDVVHLSDAPPLPNVSRDRLLKSTAFHAEIRQAVDAHLEDDHYRRERYRVLPVVGTHQETLQSARMADDQPLEFLREHAGRDLKGDGTVPRISATPVEISNLALEAYVSTCHASLQNAENVLHHVCEAMAGLDLDLSAAAYRSAASLPVKVSLDLEDAYWDDEPILLKVHTDSPAAPSLDVGIAEVSSGTEVARVVFPAGREGWRVAEVSPLSAGLYRCTVGGYSGVNVVTDVFTVFDHQRI
jgi:pimeloyl-ACP methyl ester carboxylesterase